MRLAFDLLIRRRAVGQSQGRLLIILFDEAGSDNTTGGRIVLGRRQPEGKDGLPVHTLYQQRARCA